jgi:hypothetical protein
MMFIKHTEDYADKKVPAGLYEAMGEFVAEAQKSGAFIEGAGLKPLRDATRVRVRNGKLTVTDGPFTESKEIVGGYALMEFPSPDAALENARRFMELHMKYWPEFEGDCEVRPLEEQG